MKVSHRLFAFAAIFCGVTGVAQAQWTPSRPINLIVPWAAGGSTDQATRVAAAELEDVLKQKIVIINQPGASGSIGTRSARLAGLELLPGICLHRRHHCLLSFLASHRAEKG